MGSAVGQYYSWGNSAPSIRWRQLTSPDLKLIYPKKFEDNAHRITYYLDTIRPHIGYGFTHGTMPTPIVIHTQNMMGNGIVMWAPKRIELLASPSSTFSEPWLKQLAIHEYRHNAQYNNLNRSTIRVLSWILGQQIKLLGHGQLGLFLLEGDAVMAETEASAFGRGMQPSFTMHYRAVGDVGSERYASDFWFGGSYKHYVPDHYHLGYQMTRWGYHRYGTGWLDKVIRYTARNPQFVVPATISLKKYYNTSEGGLFRDAFAELNRLWDSLPDVTDSSSKLTTPITSYTTYQWPLWIDHTTLVAFKKDLDRSWRVVKVDVESGREELVINTGLPSSRPIFDGRRLWWSEYRASTLWDERVNSRLCWLDVESGKTGTVRSKEQLFFPTPIGDDRMAVVVYDYSGQFSIREGIDLVGWQVDFPLDTEITGLAWDETTDRLWFIGLDDGGMWLGRVTDDHAGYERVIPSRHITINELRASEGKLWYGSIASGKDEVHYYDTQTGREYRVSQSRYGSFHPAPSPNGHKIALTTYDSLGYKLAVQTTSAAVEQPVRSLPVNLVNPDWGGWTGFPKMDSLVYTAKQEVETEKLRSKPYRKGLKLFNFHSWLPLDLYPPTAIEEMSAEVNLGATVMSQNLLSDMTSWLSYGWNHLAGSSLKGGLTYTGLGPHIDVGFTWGGSDQAFYVIDNNFPSQGLMLKQGIDLDKYFSINTRISLPLVLGSAHTHRELTPAVEYLYTNGLIFKYSPPTTGILTRGVERLNLSLTYGQQTRTAYRDFLPRWGFTVRGNYVVNPTNRDFQSLYSVFVRGYLPGVAPHHSTSLRVNWQEMLDGTRPLSFQMKDVFPRGAIYNFTTQRWAAGSVDYQLPVWYPDSGIPSILYFKRLRLNLFADYAHWQDHSSVWHPLYSYGGDLIIDLIPLKMPAAATMTAKITIAKPSDRPGIAVMFGFSTPL
jgi:hypothetical protein